MTEQETRDTTGRLIAVLWLCALVTAVTVAAGAASAGKGEELKHLVQRTDHAAVWWCPSTCKVMRDEKAPRSEGDGPHMAAAGGEYEALQVVVTPTTKLTGFHAGLSDFKGPGGATIPADRAELLKVGYVHVTQPTDEAGSKGWWPDPLPPLEDDLTLEAGLNHPLWVRVHVPRGTKPGTYSATLTLDARAEEWTARVPLTLEVFGFDLPEKLKMQTAFGISERNIRRYHHLETDEQMKKVWDKYMENYRAHGISPYDPCVGAVWRTQVDGLVWDGGAVTPELSATGKSSVKIVDESAESNASVSHTRTMDVDPARNYELHFAARTASDGQEFMVSLSCRDADGNWMRGQNVDMVFAGSTNWKTYQKTIQAEEFPDECRGVRMELRAARWDPNGDTKGTTWYDEVFFAAEGGNENLVADPGFEGKGLEVTPDFSRSDPQLEKYIDELGFQTLRLRFPFMPGKDRLGSIGPYVQGTSAYEKAMGGYFSRIADHLEKRGWLDESFAYWFDEPRPEHYDRVCYGMNLLHEHAPGIRRMLTEQPEEALYDCVDLWCPVLHRFDPELGRERLQAGDDMWWYVCTGPKAPYAGLFIDHGAVDLRIWQWMAWKYDVSGCLVWQTNYWTSRAKFPDKLQNPWEDPMSYRSRGKGWWGNGDGRFVYPPQVDPNSEHEPILQGPIDSIRWEMLREGFEDYQYFYMLDQALEDGSEEDAADLLNIPENIVTSPKEFTRTAGPLYRYRHKLAEALERLKSDWVACRDK